MGKTFPLQMWMRETERGQLSIAAEKHEATQRPAHFLFCGNARILWPELLL